MKADTPEQQALLDAIQAEAGTDWFDRLGYKKYDWGTVPSDGRAVLWIDDDALSISTLPGGTVALAKKQGTVTLLASIKDGQAGVFEPRLHGDPGLN